MRRLLLLFVAACLLVACPQPEPEPEPGPFVAGSAAVRMPVPLGIGTAGYGFFGAPSNPSPYADQYPGTERLHGHPDFTAVALSRGEGFELIVIRTDMIAVVQQLRDAVVVELEERTGRNYDDALVIGATHTHSGPGRFIQGGLFHLIADHFVPSFYVGMVDAMADAVELALEDMGPAELGFVVVDAPDAHSDRRCEDGVDYTNDDLGLIAVRKEGEVTALIMTYAIHGTVLDMEEFTLGKDVSGAIEEKVAHAFDHPVDVMMINAWAGDVAPSAPGVPPATEVSAQPGGYDGMEEIGLYMAGVVTEAVDAMTWSAEPALKARTYRYRIDHQSIGYDWGEFDYDYGAVYCDTADATCDEVIDHPDLTDGCIPFPEHSPAPTSSVFTVGEVGPAFFTTWGGESGTMLAEATMGQMSAHEGVDTVLFFGYGNDYLGYQIAEEDWWHGGYEASGGMWGPKQGDYMRSVQGQAFDHYVGAVEELGFEQPERPSAFDMADGVVWSWETAIDAGQAAVQPDGSYPATGVATFTVQGADPGYGAPKAFLQRQVDATWEDVLAPDGRPWTSDGYGFWVDMAPVPSYDETLDPTDRVFNWTFSMPLTTRQAAFGAETGASFRLRVVVPMDSGDTMEVESDPFTIE
jgi:hypothetical protein